MQFLAVKNFGVEQTDYNNQTALDSFPETRHELSI